MQEVDFEKKTFLERISMAAREPVFSAAFAWAFEDGSPLSLQHRLHILGELSGADFSDGQSIQTATEWNEIDILVTVQRGGNGDTYIAIENKIKAVEGDQQLDRYDKTLSSLPGVAHKLFLTLGGDTPHSGQGWKPVSYAVLHDSFSRVPSSSNPYFIDLLVTLRRLVTMADRARVDENVAAAVFEDQNCRDSQVTKLQARIIAYIAEMRLRKIAQRAWMNELASRLYVPVPWQISIDETHGQAILNVNAVYGDPFLIGLQLQWRSLKAFCHPHPYPNKATDFQHSRVEEILNRMRLALKVPESVRLTATRSRGFRSYLVVEMPKNRSLDEWSFELNRQLAELYEAFPQVREIKGYLSLIASDDEAGPS